MKYATMDWGTMEAVVNKLGGMDGVQRFLRGELTVSEPICSWREIDCDADPYIPDGWKVESHKKHGQFEWDPKKIQLYLSEGQKNGKYIEGNELRKELEAQSVFNANVLDYLLAHPDLIPEDWKGKYIFFWGTIYRGSAGVLCVRCLLFYGLRWLWDFGWLGIGFGSDDPAAAAGK